MSIQSISFWQQDANFWNSSQTRDQTLANTDALITTMGTAMTNLATGLASIANQAALNRVNTELSAAVQSALQSSSGSSTSSSSSDSSALLLFFEFQFCRLFKSVWLFYLFQLLGLPGDWNRHGAAHDEHLVVNPRDLPRQVRSASVTAPIRRPTRRQGPTRSPIWSTPSTPTFPATRM